MKIKVVEDGPYRVSGEVGLARMRPRLDADDNRVEWERGSELPHHTTFDLCRCGRSGAMPFCDGLGEKEGFDGTETADRESTMARRDQFGEGPVLVLTDDTSLCSVAAFCHRGPDDVWELAEQVEEPDRRALLVDMVRLCPSGRLVLHRLPGGEPDEEPLSPDIGVIDDGPLWVRGGITVEAADGFRYELRNRVTLCRCGRSRNKPFCDGSHIRARFKDS